MSTKKNNTPAPKKQPAVPEKEAEKIKVSPVTLESDFLVETAEPEKPVQEAAEPVPAEPENTHEATVEEKEDTPEAEAKVTEPARPPLKVLFVASECAPFVKTGGLADVVGALPAVLKKKGVDVRVMLPLYSAIGHQYAPR